MSVVSHFSDRDELADTLRSLAAAVSMARASGQLGTCRCTLIDNSEDAQEAAELARLLAAPELAPLDERQLERAPNRGYGAAHNRAIRGTAAEFHLVLNPDVRLAPEALSAALAALEAHPACVLLTPHTVDPAGHRQHVAKARPGVLTLLARALPGLPAAVRDALGNARYELRDRLDLAPVSGPFLAGGCFMLCRTQALQRVEGFDERYFMYFEDFDLSLRMSAGGDRILYAPSVRIVHGGGQAARKGLRHILWFARSAGRFMNRHGWRWTS